LNRFAASGSFSNMDSPEGRHCRGAFVLVDGREAARLAYLVSVCTLVWFYADADRAWLVDGVLISPNGQSIRSTVY